MRCYNIITGSIGTVFLIIECGPWDGNTNELFAPLFCMQFAAALDYPSKV